MYHRHKPSHNQIDPFLKLIWNALDDPKKNQLKICEALHFFGYFWEDCNQFKENNE